MLFLRVEDGKKDKKKIYLPLLLVDEMRSRLKDLIVRIINVSSWSRKSPTKRKYYLHVLIHKEMINIIVFSVYKGCQFEDL